MARLKLEELISALTDLKVEFDPSLSYKELYDLYLSKKEGTQEEVLSNEGEEKTTSETEVTPTLESAKGTDLKVGEPLVGEVIGAETPRTGESAVMKTNVKHDGQYFLSGATVYRDDNSELFDKFKAQGFLA